MALVDVTELLGDPDFVATMQQISRTYRVDIYGKNVMTESIIQTVGSIQPISGRDLQKLPEMYRAVNVMTFWLKGTIVASEPGKYSDILVFKGRRFQVLSIYDWSSWGAGWSEGACIAEVPSP